LVSSQWSQVVNQLSVQTTTENKLPTTEVKSDKPNAASPPIATVADPNSAAASRQPAQEQVSQPVQPAGTTSTAQSPAPATLQPSTPITPQPQQKQPETPPPEFLNPSSNPLLFPTQSEEVQVRGTQPITLQQALELGRRNNRDLQAAQLTLERTQTALQEALAAEFPTAGFVADFTRSESAQTKLSNERQAQRQLPPPFNQVITPSNPISTTFNGALQLSYDLYTAGRRPAAIRAASEQIRFQQLEVERISEQLRLNITNAYYALQDADAQVEISLAAVTDATQSLRDALLQEQAGLGTRFDVLQAQVQLANANQDLTRAQSQQRISRRQIVRLLSLGQAVEVSAADPIAEAGNWDLSLEQSIVLAYKNRAELEQFLVQRNISEQQRTIALAAIRPQASLTAGYNIFGVLDDNLGPQQGLTLGARLQWNFFDGGAARARAQQQTLNIAIAETNFANQRNQVRLDVEQAFFDLNANKQNIQTAAFALERARESLRLARLRFQAGVGTQLEVINQQTELTRARGNLLRAILDYNRALAALQRAISNLPNNNLSDLP
jgi:OMF family outer membrane factor